jgi:curved DNA-binding protein CbpA
MIAKTLYEILGVPVDATDVQIKRAFRKGAKKMHPDHGGDPEKFREINHAYEVLSDPARRQRYDDTGQSEDPKGPPPDQKLLIILSSAICEIVGRNPLGCNVVQCTRDLLKAKIRALNNSSEQHRQSARTLRGIAENVIRDGDGENVVSAVLDSQAGQCESSSERLLAEADEFVKVLAMLDGYRWNPDGESNGRATRDSLSQQYAGHFITFQ